jgi:hypothetical protein
VRQIGRPTHAPILKIMRHKVDKDMVINCKRHAAVIINLHVGLTLQNFVKTQQNIKVSGGDILVVAVIVDKKERKVG